MKRYVIKVMLVEMDDEDETDLIKSEECFSFESLEECEEVWNELQITF